MTAALAQIRFGYGLGPFDAPISSAAMLAAASGPDLMAVRYPVLPYAGAMALEARRHAAASTGQDERARQLRAELRAAPLAAMQAAYARGLDDPAPLRERLTWFWADHFTVVARNEAQRAGAAGYVDEAIRPHILGRFSALLKAVMRHPAMLVYLDQHLSVGPDSPVGLRLGLGLNENLARELLELHTLGVGGGYSQGDVRAAAELLTGLTIDETRAFVFRSRLAQPGPETVLGQSYGADPVASLSDIEGFLDDLARHPETIAHICRKLAVHFVAEDPPRDLVRDLEAVWRETEGDLGALTEALLTHPAAQEPALRKIKPPIDFTVSALRALGVRGADMAALTPQQLSQGLSGPLKTMGQPFMWPGGPDGWSEAADHWITPQGLASRIGWARWMVDFWQADDRDPRDFLDATLPGLASDTLRFVVSAAETRAEGLVLVLAAPEFNRR